MYIRYTPHSIRIMLIKCIQPMKTRNDCKKICVELKKKFWYTKKGDQISGKFIFEIILVYMSLLHDDPFYIHRKESDSQYHLLLVPKNVSAMHSWLSIRFYENLNKTLSVILQLSLLFIVEQFNSYAET